MSLPVQIDSGHGLASLGGEPQVFHCHHYNCFLQKTVLEQSALVDSVTLLTRPAAETAFSQLESLKASSATCEEVFSTLGFGKVTLSGLQKNGGSATVTASHYALGWLSKYGKTDKPVCFMIAGWVEGAARHLMGSAFTAKEVECCAAGGKVCRFEITAGGPALSPSPGMGTLATFGPRPSAATTTSVDEAAIIQACGGLPLFGNAEGNIHAFGVSLTRHYANYYNLLSFRFDQAMAKTAGEAAAIAARILLVEAGHVCAFNTFGGIMESAEWDALIAPQCKTREDWLYGMVAVVNALGWGRWSVAQLNPGRSLELQVDGSYESNGYLAAFSRSDTPRCYLATGGTAGLMNLLYNADITKKPALTPQFYEQTFKSPGYFVGREVECRAMGAPACRFVAERM